MLVVEDQAAVRTYVSAALRSYGYHVLQVADAEDAFVVCQRERGHLDLVLTDVVMPKQSGQELAARIWERWPGTKVLFMSGYADETMIRHGLPARPVDFIQKPFNPEQLAAKVREIVKARRQQA